MSLDAIAEKMKARAESSDFDSVVKFDCGDDGVIVIDKGTVTTEDKDADCTISVSKEDLESLAAGELDATSAFMQGKIKIDGDMGIAMKLSQIL